MSDEKNSARHRAVEHATDAAGEQRAEEEWEKFNAERLDTPLGESDGLWGIDEASFKFGCQRMLARLRAVEEERDGYKKFWEDALAANAVHQANVQRLTAEVVRLQGLADYPLTPAGSRLLEQTQARARALVEALHDWLAQHDHEWQTASQRPSKEARCPCRQCQNTRLILTPPAPRQEPGPPPLDGFTPNLQR